LQAKWPTDTLQLLLGPSESKVLYTLQLPSGGPFESVVSLCKPEFLHITVVIGGPFTSRVAHLHIPVALGDTFEGGILSYDVDRKKLYERIINFSPKIRNIYARNTLSGAPEKRGTRQVLRLPSLKHTTVYNPDNDLI